MQELALQWGRLQQALVVGDSGGFLARANQTFRGLIVPGMGQKGFLAQVCRRIQGWT